VLPLLHARRNRHSSGGTVQAVSLNKSTGWLAVPDGCVWLILLNLFLANDHRMAHCGAPNRGHVAFLAHES
jgi:hypothetical protein